MWGPSFEPLPRSAQPPPLLSPSGQSGTANPFAPKSLRASAGAALHLPLLTGVALPILLAQFRASGIQSLAASSHASAGMTNPCSRRGEVDWRQPVALLIGNEGAGLPEEIERSADARIRIPMASSVRIAQRRSGSSSPLLRKPPANAAPRDNHRFAPLASMWIGSFTEDCRPVGGSQRC